MRIKPEGRKLIVKDLPRPEEEDKVGSIVIPHSVAVADLQEATVVEVSDDFSHKFKEGDTILHPSKAGLGLLYKGEPHLWLREQQDEIWAKIIKETSDKGDGL